MKTSVSIQNEAFLINGELTYKGRQWKGHKIEGLLLNTRMVQGTFDDLNPETVGQWAYEDTGKWDADRNTSEFIEQMPNWRDHGVLGITVNLQGGSPYGYSKAQPWVNSAFREDGSLIDAYMARLERILKAADDLGMVVIVGYFYFGQEKIFNRSSEAVKAAIANATQWLLDSGYENVIIEINNECDIRYKVPEITPEGVHESIDQAKAMTKDGRRLLVGTSYGGGRIPSSNVCRSSDFMLIHGNSVEDPKFIAEMVRRTRAVPGYSMKPILFNEDDHFDFDKPSNNFVEALSEYASWGFFDYRMKDEGYDEGYQSVPVNWGISSDRKRGFFDLAKEISGF